MNVPDRALLAVDASALGPRAAYGAVLLLPDGTRLEMSGPLPRNKHQEVTAAVAALRFLPAGMPATLYVDAQADVLLASLCITHPHVQVQQLSRNSTPEHERAHDLARAALKALGTPLEALHASGPQLAVFTRTAVDSSPRVAVAYWQGDELVTRTQMVPKGLTKALTLQAIEDAARTLIPSGLELVITGRATPRGLTPSWNVTREQLAAMRQQAEAALVNSEVG
ncbi:hypothetical protein MF271_19020 (plasmid) [Deinococcus sp. KNUC1210]|uniref:hypothetical protein n=1 Tax=Deinococcus sp. KNUC1210 TaxID=2917691 RepID=UPI001EF08F4B|nr:hypothetical protein [Deinococcus sp. KNUC1210]ULH17413.1 hypothetical protein MF271_19020 [Deinococcus sp. KNUC1210]